MQLLEGRSLKTKKSSIQHLLFRIPPERWKAKKPGIPTSYPSVPQFLMAGVGIIITEFGATAWTDMIIPWRKG